jgi:hypothetical protein
VQRVWLQVALAALAGLGSLAVCSGALVAIVSLVIEVEGHSVAVRLGRASVIAAVAIYCASLLAHWLVPGDTSPSYLAPYVVAAFSLPVLPAIVAMLRSG